MNLNLFEKLYKYTLEKDWEYESPRLLGLNYDGVWGKIENGKMTVYRGYSWDGCSIKLLKIGKLFIGTPDGWFEKGKWKWRKDWTKFCSLPHDFLYQFHEEIEGLLRSNADLIFKDRLHEERFPRENLYYSAVDKLGGIYWKS